MKNMVLKRVIHATEEKIAGQWRVIWSGDDAERADQFRQVYPDRRRCVVYRRNEETRAPRCCLWVVEWRFSDVFQWKELGRFGTRRLADAAMREPFPLGREFRVMRFVRKKVRAW